MICKQSLQERRAALAAKLRVIAAEMQGGGKPSRPVNEAVAEAHFHLQESAGHLLIEAARASQGLLLEKEIAAKIMAISRTHVEPITLVHREAFFEAFLAVYFATYPQFAKRLPLRRIPDLMPPALALGDVRQTRSWKVGVNRRMDAEALRIIARWIADG